MEPTAVTFLDIVLDDPEAEDEFFAWWQEARAVLEHRAKALSVDLLTGARGRYSALIETALPNGWRVVSQDRPWLELDARRPKSTLTVRELRTIKPKRDISTATLRGWMAQRDAGTLDFVVVDALLPDMFAVQHLPGAVNLPAGSIDPAEAETVLGAKDRLVVVYCRDYNCAAAPRAANRLHDLGWHNLVEYTPGIAEWKEEGGKLEGSSTAS